MINFLINLIVYSVFGKLLFSLQQSWKLQHGLKNGLPLPYLLNRNTIKVIIDNWKVNLNLVNGIIWSTKGLNIKKHEIKIRNVCFMIVVIFLLNDDIIDYNYKYIFFIIYYFKA